LISITQYLYRNSARRAIACLCVVFLSLTFAAAQARPQHRDNSQVPSISGNKKAKRGPRAIAVVEFLPDGGMRLVPVALWIEGRYYDASLYSANPEPMAIEPRTVYEAQSFGEPTGTFTVTTPKQVNGNWAADGTWQPHLAMDVELAKQAAKDAALKPKPKPGDAVMTGNEDDSRPVLKRAPGSSGDSTNAGQPAPSGGNDSDRPVMKKPPPDSSSRPTLGSTDEPPANVPASTAKTQTTVDDRDSDRPVFKRPASAAAESDTSGTASASTTITPTAASSNDSDPNRPVLSRNKPTKASAVPAAASAITKSDMTAPTQAKAARAYPAISDAGQYESRSLLYSMSSGERQVFEQQTLKLAMDEIRAFAAKRNGPPIPKTAAITDYDVRAFDLDYSNSPTVVLSAKLPVAAAKGQRELNFNYFVTVVARVDINNQAQKIFSLVTDSHHLDAFPRMELIDAVDADANGRGDLLFRQYSDSGVSYGLYRVSPYQIEKIFEGGSSL
jgi:hypothetical protein